MTDLWLPILLPAVIVFVASSIVRTTITSTIDGQVYALPTAGTFGWLRPR